MLSKLKPLEISADLRCEIDSRPFEIRSEDRTIVVEVPDVASGLKLLQLGLPRGSRRRRLNSLKRLLDRIGVIVEVRVTGDSIFEIGHDTGTRLWRVIGLPTSQINLNKVMRFWWGSR